MAENTSNAEFRRRRRNIVVLGALVLVGFFLPMAERASAESDDLEFRFVLPELLLDPDASPSVRVMLGLTVLAGLAAVVLGMMRYSPLRAAVLILLPMAQSGLGFVAGRAITDQLPDVTLPGLTAGLPIVLGMNVVGVLILLIGIRILTYRHDSEWGMPMAVIGGCVYLVSLLIPVLPYETGSAILALPFRLLATGRAELIKVGICVFLEIAGTLAALCVVATATRMLPRRRRLARAKTASWFWTFAKVGTLAFFLMAAADGADRPMVGAALINIAGMLAYAGGLGLMFIAGIVDAAIGPERSGIARPAAAAARRTSPLPPAGPPIAPGTIAAARRQSPPPPPPQSQNEEPQ